MHLTKYLSTGSIRVGLESVDKNEVINRTVDLLAGAEEVIDLEEVRRMVLKREAMLSTGVGKGLGLPHAKTAAMAGTAAALSITTNPIDFDAFDGEPVRIVFLLVGPSEDQAAHIRTLSRISRIMSVSETRDKVVSAGSPEEVFAAIEHAERALLEDPNG
jgi:fructose PTS system EIIA component